MNALLSNLVFNAVNAAVKTETLCQVCDRTKAGRTLFVLTDILHIDEDADIHSAIRTLEKLIIREDAKRGHHSFSSNQLVMLKQHHASLCAAVGREAA